MSSAAHRADMAQSSRLLHKVRPGSLHLTTVQMVSHTVLLTEFKQKGRNLLYCTRDLLADVYFSAIETCWGVLCRISGSHSRLRRRQRQR